MDTNEKLIKLRENMIKADLKAVIIPNTDPHGSEYVHSHWKTRAWFSGFDGSAGTLVVTMKEAGLWTDFRYYIDAANKIKESEIKLYKDGLPETPSIIDFLKQKLETDDKVGFDGTLFSTSEYEKYYTELNKKNIEIVTDFDPTDDLWLDRPVRPTTEAYELSIKYCGETRDEKISRVRKILAEKGANYYIISALADIAWLLNIRASDVNYTPLVIAYVVIDQDNVNLFIEGYKLSKKLIGSLEKSNIKIHEYANIADYILKIKSKSTIYYMPESLNCYLSGLIPKSVNVIRGTDITTELKSIKNITEIKNIRIAMEKDGVALIKFFKKFEDNLDKERYTEYSLAPLLRSSRLAMENCVDESFGPIIGYHSNGALCHYSAKESTAKTIKREGLLLIDSGGQYYEGTTDITRTISMGNPTVEEILHYTLVLQGHIRLSMAKFPEGTTGAQLDILARLPLWNAGLNFGHGTGHGVGFFLGVHEGPQTISSRGFKTALKEGMVTSNEPGLYIEGKHGIRIENLILTKFDKNGLDQRFLNFETLTLFPYDINLIDTDMLLQEEIDWINNYHSLVRERLTPYLDKDEVKWLESNTREI